MQFLTPIWFFAAAALVIPVVIHLWNIKPGRVLKVGSISLISEASRKSSRSFKLTDIPLLLLRCLFLLLVAMLLAVPVLEQHTANKKSKGWLLIPRETFNQSYTHYKKSIDSLNRAGYEFHFFSDSLPKANLAELLKNKDIKDTILNKPADYWSLVKQLDTKVAADVPVYLFTSNSAKHFVGDNPAADLNLHWQTYADADSTQQWIQDAWFKADKTIRVVKGTSSPAGINFDYSTIRSDKGDAQFTVNVQNGQLKVGLAKAGSSEVQVDTAQLSIAVYTDHFQTDAGYLKAALDAAAQFSQKQVVIKEYSNPVAIPKGQTWIFWLSEQPVPNSLLAQPVNIFAYQKGKQNAVATGIVSNDVFSLPTGEEQVSLFKVNANTNASGILWHDGYGNALLSANKKNVATVFSFYSRFSPAWNGLVWNSSFPRKMLQLVFDTDTKDLSKYDRRVACAAQLMPVKTTEKNIIGAKFSVKKDLAIYFWVALMVVFFAERWLATSNKTVQNNG